MKHSAHAQSFRTYNAVATATRRSYAIDGAVLTAAVMILLGLLIAIFAYQTDPRPVHGTRECSEARAHFETGPLIPWAARSETDSYEQYRIDRSMAQCKAKSVFKYIF